MVMMVPHEAFACRCERGDPPKHFGCEFFLWKKDRLRDLMSSPGAPSAGPSTPSRNAECSNYKQLRGRISVLKATMEMHMHPEQHTLNSAALLHEILNEMEKLDLE
ncbi:hypothetical protein Tco_1216144 [Tanacetum coccineum]